MRVDRGGAGSALCLCAECRQRAALEGHRCPARHCRWMGERLPAGTAAWTGAGWHPVPAPRVMAASPATVSSSRMAGSWAAPTP